MRFRICPPPDQGFGLTALRADLRAPGTPPFVDDRSGSIWSRWWRRAVLTVFGSRRSRAIESARLRAIVYENVHTGGHQAGAAGSAHVYRFPHPVRRRLP